MNSQYININSVVTVFLNDLKFESKISTGCAELHFCYVFRVGATSLCSRALSLSRCVLRLSHCTLRITSCGLRVTSFAFRVTFFYLAERRGSTCGSPVDQPWINAWIDIWIPAWIPAKLSGEKRGSRCGSTAFFADRHLDPDTDPERSDWIASGARRGSRHVLLGSTCGSRSGFQGKALGSTEILVDYRNPVLVL